MIHITDMKKDVLSVISNCAVTHEQAMMNLSSIPLNYVEFFDTTPKFREKYRNADLLLMDDVQFIAGKKQKVSCFTNSRLRSFGRQAGSLITDQNRNRLFHILFKVIASAL